MKDFNRFQELAGEQRELAEQSKAYQDKPQLNAEDRLALRDMGARQRDLAQKLEQLEKKLRHDAEAAQEEFPGSRVERQTTRRSNGRRRHARTRAQGGAKHARCKRRRLPRPGQEPA